MHKFIFKNKIISLAPGYEDRDKKLKDVKAFCIMGGGPWVFFWSKKFAFKMGNSAIRGGGGVSSNLMNS